MFRIYKRGKIYWADITIPDPEGGEPLRIRKSTKQKTKREAQAAAATMDEAERKTAGADGETSEAVLAALQEAARLHAQGRLTLEKGRALVAEMVAASTGEKLEFKSKIRLMMQGFQHLPAR